MYSSSVTLHRAGLHTTAALSNEDSFSPCSLVECSMFNLFSSGMFDVQCCDVHRGNEASFPLVLSDACSNFHPQLPPREDLKKINTILENFLS